MNYHNITKDDMLNGDGLRVVLWVSGCDHHCKECQNPQTWDPDSGIKFDDAAKEELYESLSRDYISGITFSIDSRAADIHPDAPRVERLEEFFLPAQGIINKEWLFHVVVFSG